MDSRKDFRKIPANIKQKLEQIKTATVIVGCVTKLSLSEIQRGAFKHLGIELRDGKPIFPDSAVPDGASGRYSEANAIGEEVRRDDLPKITKTFTMQAPNWKGHGTHDVDTSREVYQREFVPPTENEIRIQLVGQEGSGQDASFVFRFTLDQPLLKRAKNFDDEMFRMLNLLQENVGQSDVFSSDATLEDYLRTIYVNWEILPPGERDSNIAKIAASIRKIDDEAKKRIAGRYDFFNKMNPEALIQGHGGFRRYFWAKFLDPLGGFANM